MQSRGVASHQTSIGSVTRKKGAASAARRRRRSGGHQDARSLVIAGVLIMGTVQNAMSLANIESFWQYVVRGFILLGAVIFDELKRPRGR